MDTPRSALSYFTSVVEELAVFQLSYFTLLRTLPGSFRDSPAPRRAAVADATRPTRVLVRSGTARSNPVVDVWGASTLEKNKDSPKKHSYFIIVPTLPQEERKRFQKKSSVLANYLQRHESGRNDCRWQQTLRRVVFCRWHLILPPFTPFRHYAAKPIRDFVSPSFLRRHSARSAAMRSAFDVSSSK